MFNLSRKMKRMLAVVLVETIVATNVFVSYAEEDHSIMCQMTVEEADAAAAEQEQKNEEVSVPQVTENSETENTPEPCATVKSRTTTQDRRFPPE